ncbi:hypothetical protein GCM10009548_22190 [Streptomyces malaysiensis subsp. malaysiensis]|uniref:Lipoprotein n=1 Tax=Streptomyces malaysiensis TaxID=92644 RepID=A0ABX6WC74_STRMQ|nr:MULTISPECIES: hypothetical protein [Streptomyces]QPI58249.1 hypothetical protein I1A49_28060 [Streptomyces solisilvae]UHH19834.1 hypothetical protein LUV23_28260 [Streptomyces sp. HNM0561]
MRKINAAATVAVAVLALALTGCGKDDDKGDQSSGTSDRTAAAEQADDAERGTPSATPTGASPSPSRTKPAEKSPGARPSSPRATRTADGTTPAPRRTAPRTQAPAQPPAGAPASVQGTWYSEVRDPNGNALVMTVTGGSLTVGYQGKSCPGTISAGMAVTMTCQGETISGGQAVVSDGGQRLTVNWPQGKPDRYVRP